MLRALADVITIFDKVADAANPVELIHQLRFIPPRERRIDPVGEAEVYLVYNRYKRARQVLLHTVKTEPDNLPAKILLLHTYFLLESSKEYCLLAAQLQPKLQHQPEWQHICQQGLGLAPNHPLFQPSSIQYTN